MSLVSAATIGDSVPVNKRLSLAFDEGDGDAVGGEGGDDAITGGGDDCGCKQVSQIIAEPAQYPEEPGY